jgi:hypothetical protein
MGVVQVIIQTQALVVIRVYGDFGYEGWRGEELNFDPAFRHKVVGSGESGAYQEESGGG